MHATRSRLHRCGWRQIAALIVVALVTAILATPGGASTQTSANEVNASAFSAQPTESIASLGSSARPNAGAESLECNNFDFDTNDDGLIDLDSQAHYDGCQIANTYCEFVAYSFTSATYSANHGGPNRAQPLPNSGVWPTGSYPANRPHFTAADWFAVYYGGTDHYFPYTPNGDTNCFEALRQPNGGHSLNRHRLHLCDAYDMLMLQFDPSVVGTYTAIQPCPDNLRYDDLTLVDVLLGLYTGTVTVVVCPWIYAHGTVATISAGGNFIYWSYYCVTARWPN